MASGLERYQTVKWNSFSDISVKIQTCIFKEIISKMSANCKTFGAGLKKWRMLNEIYYNFSNETKSLIRA